MNDERLSPQDLDLPLADGERFGRKLWEGEVLDAAGHFYNAERTARAIGCSASEARVVAWWWD